MLEVNQGMAGNWFSNGNSSFLANQPLIRLAVRYQKLFRLLCGKDKEDLNPFEFTLIINHCRSYRYKGYSFLIFS